MFFCGVNCNLQLVSTEFYELRFIETERSPAEKSARLAALLGLSQPPSRASLLKDCNRFGIVNLASQDLKVKSSL